jgi:hypothetical protein
VITVGAKFIAPLAFSAFPFFTRIHSLSPRFKKSCRKTRSRIRR